MRMTKIIILFVGVGLTVTIGAFLFMGMAFSSEASKGRHGDAISTLFLCLAWAFCLLPAAAAIYKVGTDNMSVQQLVLCWAIGLAGSIGGALGYETFFPGPSYTTASNPDSINSFTKFKNANAEFAKESPEIVMGLFQPTFDQSGKMSVEFGRAEDRVMELAKTMGSPIYISQEDGKGDRVFLAYPYEVDSNFRMFPTTKTELKRLTSGQPVSSKLLSFLASLPSTTRNTSS
jgi:hypothetical protein